MSFLNHLPVKLHIFQRILLQPSIPESLPSLELLHAIRSTAFTSVLPQTHTQDLLHAKHQFSAISLYDTEVVCFFISCLPYHSSKQKCSLTHLMSTCRIPENNRKERCFTDFGALAKLRLLGFRNVPTTHLPNRGT